GVPARRRARAGGGAALGRPAAPVRRPLRAAAAGPGLPGGRSAAPAAARPAGRRPAPAGSAGERAAADRPAVRRALPGRPAGGPAAPLLGSAAEAPAPPGRDRMADRAALLASPPAWPR